MFTDVNLYQTQQLWPFHRQQNQGLVLYIRLSPRLPAVTFTPPSQDFNSLLATLHASTLTSPPSITQ